MAAPSSPSAIAASAVRWADFAAQRLTRTLPSTVSSWTRARRSVVVERLVVVPAAARLVVVLVAARLVAVLVAALPEEELRARLRLVETRQ
jgi:hypothetical protein